MRYETGVYRKINHERTFTRNTNGHCLGTFTAVNLLFPRNDDDGDGDDEIIIIIT